jgi:hypothetical protein
MDTKVRIAVFLTSLVWMYVILRLVKNRKIWEKYAIFWVYMGFLVLVAPLLVDLLDEALYALGVDQPPNFYLFVGILGVLMILLQLSVEITTVVRQARDSIQSLAILEERVRRLEGERAGAAEGEPSSAS